MKRFVTLFCITLTTVFLFAGCSGASGASQDIPMDNVSATDPETSAGTILEDGQYQAAFDTDSSMFHVNEACDGKGTLTVKDGEMTIHISLVSENIVRLYPGTTEDAADADEAELLAPTTDTVTYSDGISEEVYGFDVPVPALDEEFDLAILGTKGTWYDHKVSVSDPVKVSEMSDRALEDGGYTIEVTLDGGSGKAGVESPCTMRVENGEATARIRWSSSHYDYMLVDGEKYLPVSEEGNSVFEIPVSAFDEPVTVIGDTTAMSTPHEIEYTLTFDRESAEPLENGWSDGV